MKKNIIRLVFLLTATVSIWGQAQNLSSIYRKLDVLVANNDIAGVDTVLAVNKDSESISAIENYLTTKCKNLVFDGNIEKAESLALVLVDFNMDNLDAAGVYDSIIRIKEKNKEQEEKAAEKIAREEQKEEKYYEKIKEDVKKTYVPLVNEKTGEAVYWDQNASLYYRSGIWNVTLDLFNLNFLTGYKGFQMKYGIGLEGNYYYYGEHFRIGFEGKGESMLLSFLTDNTLNASFKALIVPGYAPKTVGFMGRLGIILASDNVGDEIIPPENFVSPVIGLGLRDIPIGYRMRVNTFFDYYPGHIYTKGMNFSGEAGLDMCIDLVKFDTFSVVLKTGLNSRIDLWNEAVKNQTRIFVGLGVGNNE